MGVCVGCGSTELWELHICPTVDPAAARVVAALRSELEQVKRERDAWKEQRDAEQEAWTLANARAERAMELRKYVGHLDACIRGTVNVCTCGLSDLLRDLDAEEGK